MRAAQTRSVFQGNSENRVGFEKLTFFQVNLYRLINNTYLFFIENTEMLKIVNITIIVAAVFSSVRAQDCLGCASDAAVDENIVNFAVTELAGSFGGECKRDVVKVENFKRQVSALSNYV